MEVRAGALHCVLFVGIQALSPCRLAPLPLAEGAFFDTPRASPTVSIPSGSWTSGSNLWSRSRACSPTPMPFVFTSCCKGNARARSLDDPVSCCDGNNLYTRAPYAGAMTTKKSNQQRRQPA
jgi:hypothetical protein